MLKWHEKSCRVCRLQAGERQLLAGSGLGTGSDEGVCNGPSPATGLRLVLATIPAWGRQGHPLPGRWGNCNCCCPGCSPCPSGASAHLLRSVLDGLVQSPAPAFPQPGPSLAAPSRGCAVRLQHRVPVAPGWLPSQSSLLVPPSPKFNFFPFP